VLSNITGFTLSPWTALNTPSSSKAKFSEEIQSFQKQLGCEQYLAERPSHSTQRHERPGQIGLILTFPRPRRRPI
jgi:hypothetical protein